MARKDNKFHFIYKTTNIITGRYYFGMHSTSNIDDGYLGSGRRLRYSINKYGKENHKREIIEFCEDRSSLIKREKEIVNLNEIAKKDCMNIIEGGSGGFTVEQQRENSRRSNLKQKILRETDPEWLKRKCEKISKSNKKTYENGRERKYFYDWNGKTHSEETKQKMSFKGKQRVGDKNSSYGTHWITNGIENKKIKHGSEIPNGWKLGRVINK